MGSRWSSARRHLTPIAEGGLAVPGAPPVTFRTAPLPDGVPVKLWEDCECSYVPGDPKEDPAWTQWLEDPPRQAGQAAGKQCLRYALSDPRHKSDGGLLGPNFYHLGNFHSGDARMDQPGFPDFLIFTLQPVPHEAWELKAMGQHPTLPQAHHMTYLEQCGYRVRTVRPCCLLCGDVDRWLGRLAGVKPTLSRWARRAGDRPVLATPATAGPPARAALTARAPARRRVPPPGDPVDLDDPAWGRLVYAEGYVVAMPGDQPAARAAAAALEGWLRAQGLSPVDIPWPMRLITDGARLLAWANDGPSPGPGHPRPRAWRSVPLTGPLPGITAADLNAVVVHRDTVREVAHHIEAEAGLRPTPEVTP